MSRKSKMKSSPKYRVVKRHLNIFGKLVEKVYYVASKREVLRLIGSGSGIKPNCFALSVPVPVSNPIASQ